MIAQKYMRNAMKFLKRLFPFGRIKNFSFSTTSGDGPSKDQLTIITDERAPRLAAEHLKSASCELESIYYSHTGRLIFKWHHYIAIYDRHLSAYRDSILRKDNQQERLIASGEKLRILEIGVLNGGSLQMWKRYFGDTATIYGIDINPDCKQFEEEGCHVRIGDQSDPAFLQSVIKEMGGVDIVIDDGSHIATHQAASFRTLFPLLTVGGLYICEDLHTSYWDGWEGGYRRPGTFIELTKDIIDHMHEWYAGIDTPLNKMGLKRHIGGLHVYDSMVVIEKEEKAAPYAIHVGVQN
jgi:cephalosporin hydroxylase